ELFCSSSWFQSGFDPSRFPWPGMSSLWASLLKPELLQLLRMEEYAAVRLQEALDSCPVLRGEPAHSRQMRELSYLTLTRYLPSLLEREDRCSMANGLELRSPYTDHRLIQYVFNLPWEWKCGPQKNLFTELRKAFLPKDAPKPEGGPQSGPSGPEYGPLLKQRLTYILQDSLQPIQKLLSPEAVKQFLAGPLPSDPLTASALIQVNYWLLHYGIYLKL
ncbi:MAG: asparagine synthase-related protein, partial [Neglectibacter sp.]